MSISDLKDALRHIPGIERLTMKYGQSGQQILKINDRSVVVGPNASTEEIERALTTEIPTVSYPIRSRVQTPTQSKPIMSISGYQPGAIRDKLNALKQKGKERRDQALAKLDDAGKKHEAVSAEIEVIAAQVEKEADDALQEFAEFSNGGPA